MLVNFIRHSFVVCDETSVSEAILQSPVISAKAGGVQLLMARLKTPQLAAFDEEFEDSSEVESTSGSPDIQIGTIAE